MEAGATRTDESREAALIQPPPATAAAPLRPCRRAPPSDPAAARIPSSAKATKMSSIDLLPLPRSTPAHSFDGISPRLKNDIAIFLIFILASVFIGILASAGTLVAHGLGESWSRAICLERINAGSYTDMAVIPGDSRRVFPISEDGKHVREMTMPEHGRTTGHDDGKAARTLPFLSLSDIVPHGADGLEIKGIVVHPKFAENGRVILSYICIERSSLKRRLLVEEFFVQQDYSKGMTKTAEKPKKVKTILTMELPQLSNQGGQILLEHKNNRLYLYIIIGHGVIKSAGGYVDLSWDKSAFNGKVIRVEINDSPGILREIIAMGVGDPKGCSIDAGDVRRSMRCGLVDGTAQIRLIDIEKGTYKTIYRGSLENITGGFKFDGASTDPSLEGRYIYSYNSSICTVTETPEGSGHYTSERIKVGCSVSSPMACDPNSFDGPGFVVHFIGKVDNNGDAAAVFLTAMGVYRLVHPALCRAGIGKHPSPPDPAHHWSILKKVLVYGGIPSLLLIISPAIWWCVSYIVLPAVFPGADGGGQQQAAPLVTVNNSCSCFNNGSCCICLPRRRQETIELQQLNDD